LDSGADPTIIVSYNANAVKFYNETSSVARFKKDYFLLHTLKTTLWPTRYNAGGVVVVSKLEGLDPWLANPT
jgi:hypothetical protein